jgi:hypothetical protein
MPITKIVAYSFQTMLTKISEYDLLIIVAGAKSASQQLDL